MSMFNLQPGAPAPHGDGADSKAWGIARRDSLSFLDHGIGPAPPAALIPRCPTVPNALPNGRPALPDLQTARSWGSLASQTLAMYPEVRLPARFGSTESACFGNTESALGRRRLRSPEKHHQSDALLLVGSPRWRAGSAHVRPRQRRCHASSCASGPQLPVASVLHALLFLRCLPEDGQTSRCLVP